MTNKFESQLELSVDNLQMRREQLQDELRNTVLELLSTGLRSLLKEEFAIFGIDDNRIKSVSWDFYYESDDQGGTDPHIESLSFNTFDGDEIDLDETVVEKKSSYSDNIYEVSLRDELYELFYEFSDDLHTYDIYEITM